jgi:hypothetical protein
MTITFPYGVADPVVDSPTAHGTDMTAYPGPNHNATLTPLSCDTVQVSVAYSGDGNMPGTNTWPPVIPSWTCTGTCTASLPPGFGCF